MSDRFKAQFEAAQSGKWPEGGDYLYHFTRLETLGRMLALDGRPRLRLSEFRTMSDPWEFDNQGLGFLDRLDMEREIIEALPRSITLGDTSWSVKLARERHRRKRKEKDLANVARGKLAHLVDARLRWASICLSEDGGDNKAWAQDPMWSHYADGARGICLVFHKAELLQEARTAFDSYTTARKTSLAFRLYEPAPRLASAKVKYCPPSLLQKSRREAIRDLTVFAAVHADDMRNLNGGIYLRDTEPVSDYFFQKIEDKYRELDEGCQEAVGSLCATKANGWEYEREFRMIGYSRDFDGPCPNPFTLEIPVGRSLAGVIAGPRSPAHHAAFWLTRLMYEGNVGAVWRYDGNAELSPLAVLDGDRLNLPNKGYLDHTFPW
jgi:hypothetical protein